MPVLFRPFDYQEVMRSWGMERDRFIYMCSPGVGKTVVTLDVICERILNGWNKAFLVIAPLRVGLITWPDQIALWQHSSWMKIADMRTPEGAALWESGGADIYIINYEMLASRDVTVTRKGEKVVQHYPGFVEKFIAKRKTLPVDGIVWDEISLAKNHASKRINAIRPFLHDSKTKSGKPYKSPFNCHIGLTGTPVPNDYRDLFAQVRLIDDGERLGKFITHFLNQYFEKNPYNAFDVKIRPGAKEIIDAKLSDIALVMLGDDYLDIPQTLAEDVMVELPPAAKKVYKTLEKELIVELEKGEVVALSAAALTTKLMQVTGGCAYDAEKDVHAIHDAKIDALKAIRKKHKKEPILVLTAYKHENTRILEAIPGSRMFDEKDLDQWKAGKIHTWVANPASLSHGIDGVQKGGRIAVWFTQTYSNEKYLQTNARLIRTGQSYETIIYRILARGTIDEAVCAALRRKGDTQSGFLHALKALQRLAKENS